VSENQRPTTKASVSRRTPFPVLVATDGSRPAQTAVAAAVGFPWPAGASGHGVVARPRLPRRGWPQSVSKALEQSDLRAALLARRLLRRRWLDAEVAVVDQPPVEGILAEARRLGARVVVVGARGHGALTRLVLGSVSLGVVRRAPGPVLVVKTPRPTTRLVVGVDGSTHARQAAELVTALEVPDRGAITLVAVGERTRPVSGSLLPRSLRATIRRELTALDAERRQRLQAEMDRAARELTRAGWVVETEVRTGVPLAEILAVTRATRADVLVLGARGAGGLTRLLLGSVAEGALSRSPVSVLVVR
jgi:nucleotide-binding universal stress UspA family protein